MAKARKTKSKTKRATSKAPKKAGGTKPRAAAKKKPAAKTKTASKKAPPKKVATPKKVAAKKAAAPKKAAPKKIAEKPIKAPPVSKAKAPPAKAPPAKAPPAKAPPAKAPPSKAAPSKAAAKSQAGTPKSKPSRTAAERRRATSSAPGSSGPPSSQPSASSRPSMSSEPPASEPGDLDLDLDEDEDMEESRQPRVEFAPRSNVVAPSIPIPVKSVPQRPSLEERSSVLEERIVKQSTDFRTQYQESFEMSWIYHDTALEGVVYTFEELSAAFHGEEIAVVDSSVMPIYESIRRHKGAIDFVRDAVDKKRVPMNVDLVKKIYIILHPEEGDVKTVKYRRDIPQHRLYFHEYEAPDKIAYRVRAIVDWVNSPETRKNVSTLRIAAKAHYDLARTYPFPHDSGKVARLFMNFILLRGGLPPAIVHSTERQRYYEALKAPTAGPLVQMLKDSVDNALASIEKLLEEHETKKRGFVS